MSILLGLLVIVALVVFYGINIYNKLVKLRNLVKEGWSGIDVMLKKRHDLVPNLVETVKGYAKHESETFQNVTEARTNASKASSVKEKEAAENQLNQALYSLFAVAERYPDLKANTNFMQLQNQLSDLETGIEKARRYYNGTARNYNTLIESFPSNFVANSFNFTQEQYFEVENPENRNVPDVKF